MSELTAEMTGVHAKMSCLRHIWRWELDVQLWASDACKQFWEAELGNTLMVVVARASLTPCTRGRARPPAERLVHRHRQAPPPRRLRRYHCCGPQEAEGEVEASARQVIVPVRDGGTHLPECAWQGVRGSRRRRTTCVVILCLGKTANRLIDCTHNSSRRPDGVTGNDGS